MKKLCEKKYLLRHIKLTMVHKNLIFSKQEFGHVFFLQYTVELRLVPLATAGVPKIFAH